MLSQHYIQPNPYDFQGLNENEEFIFSYDKHGRIIKVSRRNRHPEPPPLGVFLLFLIITLMVIYYY